MNYYPFHIGDYATHTAHLEPMEDLAYRRLLDLYYLREGPLPAEVAELARLVRMRSEAAAVEAVLREFFRLNDAGWTHERCEAELARMSERQAKARASAEASVAARRAKAERPLSERSATVELPTPTPTPTPRSSSLKKSTPVAKPTDVSDEVWLSFLMVRKAKKAPITALAVLGIRREAVAAGYTLEQALTTCCERGWQSFKAEWVQKDQAKPQGESFYEREQRLKAEQMAKWAPRVAAKVGRNFDFIDAEVSNVPSIESD